MTALPLFNRACITATLSIAAATTLVACGPQNGEALASAGASAAEAQAARPEASIPAQPAVVAQAQPVQMQAVPPAPVQYRAEPRREPVVQREVASNRLGEIRAIDPIRTRPQGSGAGAVVGGVLGAVLGNQIGSGNGRAAATVLGAAGGAVAGNNVERNHKEGIAGYRVRVELDNGESRTYEESSVNGLAVGDRVRVEGGRLRRI